MLTAEKLNHLGFELIGGTWDSPKEKTLLWGVAPTGLPHIGYLSSLLLSRCWQKDGGRTLLLLSSTHGAFDSAKSSTFGINDLMEQRYLHDLQPSFDGVIFADKEYRTAEYINGLYDFSSELTVHQVIDAGTGTLKHATAERTLADLLYVAMQMIDLDYFNIDVALCGQDESPIYRSYARMFPWRKKAFIFAEMCPGLISNEMHSSSKDNNALRLHLAARKDLPDDLCGERFKPYIAILEGLLVELGYIEANTISAKDIVWTAIQVCQQK